MTNSLARKLLELLPSRVQVLLPSRISYPGPNFCTRDDFWPQDLSLPDISQFETGESFLLFNVMGISDNEIQEWLSSPPDTWSFDPTSPAYSRPFDMFLGFVKQMHLDNDAAER